MIIPKTKKIFLLILLLVISGALTVVKSITGFGKTSQVQACWTPPSTPSTGAEGTEASAGAVGGVSGDTSGEGGTGAGDGGAGSGGAGDY